MKKKTRIEVTNNSTNFWERLPRPFFVLAPMADVTDSVFRKMIAKYSKPDVMWTEFVSADGLVSVGKKNLLHDLEFSDKERPIVAQLFTGRPEVMKKASALIRKLGFDGLDINMGCPDRKVEKQGGGAAMMKNPANAIAVLEAAREGFCQDRILAQMPKSDFGKTLPVTVKTRIGYNSVDWEWIRLMLRQNLPALTIHLRTRKEMSDVPAHWELMPEIIRLKNEISPKTLIIGNGDVESLEGAKLKCEQYGCDGVMIGRGIFGKPWLFNKSEISNLKSQRSVIEKTPEERLKILLEHTKLFEKTFLLAKKKKIKNFAVMKKHFKAYVSGWDGAKELRVKLMETNDFKQVQAAIKGYLALIK